MKIIVKWENWYDSIIHKAKETVECPEGKEYLSIFKMLLSLYRYSIGLILLNISLKILTIKKLTIPVITNSITKSVL